MQKLFLKFINIYQSFVSPSLGANCRFYPTCSDYANQSIKKHGAVKGSFKGLKRLIKCGPWSKGGVDLP